MVVVGITCDGDQVHRTLWGGCGIFLNDAKSSFHAKVTVLGLAVDFAAELARSMRSEMLSSPRNT